MKKILLLIMVALCFSACIGGLDSPPREYFVKSYIGTFIECGEISGKKLQIQSNMGLKIDAGKKIISIGSQRSAPYFISDDVWLNIVAQSIHYVDRDSSIYRAVPEIGRTDFLFSNGDDPSNPFYLERQRVYDKYIGIIGDTTFNLKTSAPLNPVAIITPVSEIIITCDKDYTGEFPAGSNISRLFTVFFDNPYATVKNGYKAVNGSYHYEGIDDEGSSFKLVYYPVSIIRANLAETDFSSLPFIGNQWNCHLDAAPDKTDVYTFNAKIVLVDGVVLEGETPVSIHIKSKNDIM